MLRLTQMAARFLSFSRVALLGSLGGAAAVAACSSSNSTYIFVYGPDAADEGGEGGAEASADSADRLVGDEQHVDAADAEAGWNGNVFANAMPFVHFPPAMNANTANAAHQNTVEGKDCLSVGCHVDGNQPYRFGGTVYTTSNGNTTVAQAEVRIVRSDGSEYARAYTDANGNFWFASVTPIPTNAIVGIRNATTFRQQVGPLASGACNSNACHGSASMRIFL